MTNQDVQIYFEGLDPDMIDQGIGEYEEGRPCCIGAHLGHLFGHMDKMWYEVGIDSWLFFMGLKPEEGVRLLMGCGAGPAPWCDRDWPSPPAVVFARVAAKLEEEG